MKTKLAFLTVIALLSAALAHAAEEPKLNSTTVRAEKRSGTSAVYGTLFSTFHGASLDDVASARTVNAEGKASKYGINFDSEAGFGYRLTPAIGAGIVVPFIFTPVQGEDMILGDVGAKVYNNHAFQRGGFNLGTNLTVQGATSDSSRERDMSVGLKTTPFWKYQIPRSHLSIGSWNEAKDYLGVTKGKTFKLYTQPYARYDLNDSFAVNVGYEMEWNHFRHQKAGYLNKVQSDLMPGVIWNVSRQIMVNPYVQLFTTNEAWKDAAVGAVLSANVL